MANAILPKIAISIICLVALSSVVGYSLFAGYRAEKLSRLTLGSDDSIKVEEIALIGDSRFRDITISGASTFYFGGETSPQITLRALRIIEQPQVKVAVLQVGINDLVASSLSTSLIKPTEESLISNISYLIDKAGALGKKIIITEIIPARRDMFFQRFYWFDTIYQQTRQVNERLHQLCTIKGIRFVSFPELSQSDGEGKPKLYSDSLHLNASGRKIFQAKLSNIALDFQEP